VLVIISCWSQSATLGVCQGIFENLVPEKWTVSESESWEQTAIIAFVMQLCNNPTDSVIVKESDQQQWSIS
jgi:hypothetical protein